MAAPERPAVMRGSPSCGSRYIPNRYRVSAAMSMIASSSMVGRGSSPRSSTRSALLKNLSDATSSAKPIVTLTTFIQPPAPNGLPSPAFWDATFPGLGQ